MLRMTRKLKSLAGVAIALVGGNSLASQPLPVCERSPLAVRELEEAAKKPCDQITEDDLKRMDHFQIGFNPDLKELSPEDTSGLSSARFLYLNCNPNLETVPEDLAKGMEKLEWFAIHTNPKLRTLPEGIFSHLGENLHAVSMSGNGLTSLPESFYERFAVRKSPVDFYLTGNPFTRETIERIRDTFNVELDENGQLPHRFRR